MPNLASLASEGTVFERAYANAPWTVPAHASMFTGQLPSEHGCHGGSPRFDSTDVLPEIFAEAGYETFAISNNIWISDYFGFDKGFDTFYKQWQLFREHGDLGHVLKTGETNPATLLQTVLSGNPIVNILNGLFGRYVYRRFDFGSRRTTNDALEVVDKREEPLFLFLNYMEAHAPYTVHDGTDEFLPDGVDDPERYSEFSGQSKAYHFGDLSLSNEDFQAMEGLYDGELRYLDRQLGRLIDGLETRDMLDDTLIIILGDHGENIGDHGLMAHRFSLHDTLLHVPFIVHYPNGWTSPARVTTPVDFRDLYNQLVAVANNYQPQPAPDERDEPIVAEYLDTSYTPESNADWNAFEDSKYDRLLAAAVTHEHKYVRDSRGNDWLYEFAGGDFEKSGRLVEKPNVIAELKGYCKSIEGRERHGAPSTPAEIQRHLEDLGYM